MQKTQGRGAAAGWLVATVIVLACTAFVRHQNLPDASVGGVVGRERPLGPELVAIAVFQPADCEDATEWLGALAEDGRVEIRGVLVGGGDDVARAAARLGAIVPGVKVTRANRRTLLGLRALGYGTTPYVAIVDRWGRVRWTSPPPRAPEDRRRMVRMLADLIADRTEEEP